MKAVDKFTPFEAVSGRMRLSNPSILIGLSLCLMLVAMVIARFEVVGVIGCLLLIGLVFFLHIVFSYPKFGIITILFMGFFANGLSRYVQIPWGLSIDGLLVLTYLALFFKGFRTRLKWSKARSGLTLVACIWMFYVLSQLVNPEAVSLEAWFYAMRGLAMYQWMIIPLAFLLFNKPKKMIMM